MTMMKKDKGHIVIFPFMAKGHTIPLIHLATSLSGGGLRITFITTPDNAPFLRQSLPADRHPYVHLIILPFPHHPRIPSGCESTDKLPSMDLHPYFIGAAALLRQPFDAVLSHLMRSPSPPLCLISDFFLGWTLSICRRLNLPRVVFHGMSAYSMAICKSLWVHLPNMSIDSEGGPFHLPGTPPTLFLEKSEIPEFFLKKQLDTDGPEAQVLSEVGEADVNSWGVLVNSFSDLEGEYTGLFESFYQNGARAWLVGPLCLLSPEVEESESECIRWLDEQEAGSVVYVSFGTQADVAEEQLDEVAHGLARSGCRFLWVVRAESWAPPEGMVNGKIVRWSPQREVLSHGSTGGFVSHCGWNSVIEAVSAGVPMLTWPMIAEQTLNSKMVVEELGMGMKLGGTAADGEVVRRERIAQGVRELMGDGEKGRRVRERASELRKKAKMAVEEGGSSHRRLEELIDELHKFQRQIREVEIKEELEEEEEEEEVVAVDAMQHEFPDGIQIA